MIGKQFLRNLELIGNVSECSWKETRSDSNAITKAIRKQWESKEKAIDKIVVTDISWPRLATFGHFGDF